MLSMRTWKSAGAAGVYYQGPGQDEYYTRQTGEPAQGQDLELGQWRGGEELEARRKGFGTEWAVISAA